MNYKRIHDTIIERAKARGQEAFTPYSGRAGFQRHHIIPRSLMGGDNKENIVYLTPHEHRLVHRLMAHLLEGSMQWAWTNIVNNYDKAGGNVPTVTVEIACGKGIDMIIQNKPLERKMLSFFNLLVDGTWASYLEASDKVSALYRQFLADLGEQKDFNFRPWIMAQLAA